MTTAGAAEGAGRPVPCAVHPARRAAGPCPVCARPRCAADAREAPGGGCLACRGQRPAAGAGRPAPPLERAVRAALAGTGTALLGGLVCAQYVDAEAFALLTPLVVGVLCGAATTSAARGPARGRAALLLRGLAVVCALLGTGLGFLLEGSRSPQEAATLLPYAAAVVGAVVWTRPPRRRS